MVAPCKAIVLVWFGMEPVGARENEIRGLAAAEPAGINAASAVRGERKRRGFGVETQQVGGSEWARKLLAAQS